MLQASSLALIGMLTVVGCGGSDTPSTTTKKDAAPDGTGGTTPTGVVKVDKAVLDFGSIDIGSTSTAQTVNVQVSVAPVAINATVTGSGFAISGTTCAPVQAVGACTISVKFAPASIGAATGTLAIGNAAVALSGAGQNAGTFSLTDRVDLGTLLVGATSSAVVQVVPSPSVTGLTCVASGSNLTLASQTCAATGAIAAPCTFTFTFKAATAGVKSDAVVCSAGGTVKQTTVAATVVTPAALTINPPTATFTASVGGTYVATFNVSNSGGSPTGNLSATVSAGATDFAITSNDCVVPLASLAICKIQVTFKPASAGAKTGTLTVADATVGTVPATAALTGTGIPASALAITPATSDFGTVEAGATKTTNFTIKNNGGTATDAIVIGGGSAEFAVDAALCNNLPLAPGASCAFTVTFKPAAPAGAKTAAIIATENGVAKATAQVTGTAQVTAPAALTVEPPTLDFGTIGVDTTKGPLSLTVKNNGGAATGVLSVVKKDSTSSVGGASQFTFTSPDCNGATLAPGASCTVAVTYSPTITGSASAVLTISDGAVSSANGTVIGIALSIPDLGIKCPTNTTATFDSTVVGATSASVICTVTNNTKVNSGGEAPQESGAITATATGDFAVATNNCTASLKPLESCTLLVVFKPTAKGARTGKLSVNSANKGVAVADLEGKGWLPLQLDAYYKSGTNMVKVDGTYDFGNLPMGATSAGKVQLMLAVYVHANVGNFAFSGTDLQFVQEGNGIADFTATPVTSGTTVAGISSQASANTCAKLANPTTDATITGDKPYCYVTVDFTPKAKGAKTNALTVAGANGTASDAVSMQGTGTGPLTVNPSPLTFSAVPVGTAGTETLTLTVKNSSSSVGANVTIKVEGTNASYFAIVEDLISNKPLQPAGDGDGVLVPIRLTVPAGAAVGALTATVTVTAVIGGETESSSANLVGSAVTGAGISATLAGNFADTVVTGTSAPVKVTVKNNGALATDKLKVELKGGQDFAVMLATPQSSTCGSFTTKLGNETEFKLNSGASCDFNVWFVPQAGLGVSKRNGSLTVSSRIGGMQVLPLTGNATGLLAIDPSPADLGFGIMGKAGGNPLKTLTIKNNGQSEVTIDSITVFNDLTVGQTGAPDIEVKTHNCTTLGVVGGAKPSTCAVDVWMKTADKDWTLKNKDNLPGQKAATLKIVGKVGTTVAGTATTVVTGTAVLPAILKFTSVDPDVVSNSASLVDRDFGTVALGATSAPQTFVVTNIGGSDASMLSFYFYEFKEGSTTDVSTTALVKSTELDKTGTTCTADAAVLKAGQSCKIVAAYRPSTAGSKLGREGNGVWLAVSATTGTESEDDTANAKQEKVLYGAKLFGNSIDTNVPRIVAASNNLAAYDFGLMGAPANATPATRTAVFTLTNGSPTASYNLGAGTSTTIDVANTTLVTVGGAPANIITGAAEFKSVPLPAEIPIETACYSNTASDKTLGPGASCVFAVQWIVAQGATAGTREVKVSVKNKAGEAVASINVFGRVAAKASLVVIPHPLAATTSTPLDFGKPVEGVDSLVQTVTVMNVGELATAALKVVSVGDKGALVKVANGTTCQGAGSALDPLGTCKLALTVTPGNTTEDVNEGVKKIALASDASSVSLMKFGDIVAKWQGQDGATLTPSSTTIAFDEVGVPYPGTGVLATTTKATLTITNDSTELVTGPLSFSISSADFYIDTTDADTTCLQSGFALMGLGATGKGAGGQSCKVVIYFSPTALADKAKTGTLTISAPYAPTATVPMSGTAIPALKVKTPATSGATSNGNFVVTTTAAAASMTFTTVNISTATTYPEQAFTFHKMTGSPNTGRLTTLLSGASAADFRIIDDQCVGWSLVDTKVDDTQEKTECTVTVRFAPTSSGTGKVAKLTVSDPLSGTPPNAIEVDLKGAANP